jgi:pyrroloquinoline quinone (PQQ) biosynthesis protein C
LRNGKCNKERTVVYGRTAKVNSRSRLQQRLDADLAPARAALWNVSLFRDQPEATTQAAVMIAHELQLYTSIFPRCVGGLVSQSDNDADRAVLVENLWEEHGSGDLARSHRTLFDQFYASVKRHAPDVDAPVSWLDSTVEAADSLLRVTASGFIRGLGALAVGIEAETGAQFKAVRSYFARLPNGQHLDYEFFTLHEASDDAHADAMLDVLVARVTNEGTYVLAREGALWAMSADLKFWSGVDATIERMPSAG